MEKLLKMKALSNYKVYTAREKQASKWDKMMREMRQDR